VRPASSPAAATSCGSQAARGRCPDIGRAGPGRHWGVCGRPVGEAPPRRGGSEQKGGPPVDSPPGASAGYRSVDRGVARSRRDPTGAPSCPQGWRRRAVIPNSADWAIAEPRRACSPDGQTSDWIAMPAQRHWRFGPSRPTMPCVGGGRP
jgi:hypothetical protein